MSRSCKNLHQPPKVLTADKGIVVARHACGMGVIARAHTEARDGGRLLPGHLAAGDLTALQAVMPPGLTFNPTPMAGSPPGCLGWWWD